MKIIFLFIDGVGLGGQSTSNPFYGKQFPGFSAVCGHEFFTGSTSTVNSQQHIFRHIDAQLGVDGLPQSGTGQASLFSGKNAAKAIGKHFGPFPHSGIKHLLKKESLFQKAQRMGKKCHFINAYPDIFFRKASNRNRWSCTTLMTKSADLPLNTAEEVKKGEAVTAELTQEAWRDHLDIKVPAISPETAAERVIKKSQGFDLVLHEYYLSDKAGHSQNGEQAASVLYTYDRFLSFLIENKEPTTTIVLSSDHGNVEDLSTKTHTFNKVPLFAGGPVAQSFASAESILDVTPCILTSLANANQ